MIEIIEKEEDIEAFFRTLEERSGGTENGCLDTVKKIIARVRAEGDKALEEYTRAFDDAAFTIDRIEISKAEQKSAFDGLPEKMQKVLERAKARIYEYHCHQKRQTWVYEGELGERLGQKITPIKRVGVYVPGGKAAYPSSVLMNVVPARVAGVEEITMVTPAVGGKVNPLVLAVAYLCGIDHLYTVGGAQAIAALAYGTETVGRVDKIVGPGNIFVALAKREVYGTVGIDSVAGPSEICIVADETARPKYCAADLLGQAEHDELASSVLLITDGELAKEVKRYTEEFYQTSSRKQILDVSLTKYSRIIVVPDIPAALRIANRIAPEHLELAMERAEEYVDSVQNAGAVFIGHYSPEALGDYMAGPNHVLPTVGTARFFSPLGVDDFIKKSSLICFTREASLKLIDDVDTFAMAEGLQMHALSARIRKEEA